MNEGKGQDVPHVGQQIANPVAGDTVTFIEVPQGGAGRLLVEMTTVPGGQGPPPHIHPRSNESFEVLEGEIAIEQDGRTLVLAAGERHTVPPGAVHRFLSHGDIPARTMVGLDVPGRMAEFLETFYELARAGRTDAEGKPSLPQIAVSFGALRDDIRTVVAPWPAQLAMFALLGPVGRMRGLKPFYATGELSDGTPPKASAAAPVA